MPFASLGLAPALLRAVREQGYSVPTAIQASAIPAIAGGADVWAAAPTGSGKTVAFALPLLQRLQDAPALTPALSQGERVRTAAAAGMGKRRTRVLVLVPTRELAAQVGEVFRGLAQHLPQPLKVAIIFGGVSINPQMMGLRGGADIVVATPGRLLDLVDRNALQLSNVAALVLDEADRLLDLGFADELARVLGLLPAQRQNLLFSATFPPAIDALATQLLREPVRIEMAAAPTTEAATPAIAQRAIAVDASRRTQLLRHLVQLNKWQRVMAFVATKFSAEIVADKLRKAGILAEPFHGQLSQGKRTQVLDDFKAGRVHVVVATDLAARGIDVAELPVVVNYDLPRSAVDYVHRIGRTGRAGLSGEAYSFVTADSAAHFALIEKRQGLSLSREEVAGFEPLELPVPPEAGTTPSNGGIKGKRPSKKDKLRAAAAGRA